MNTDGFKQSRAVLQESSPSGVTVTLSRDTLPGASLPRIDRPGTAIELSNVNVEEQMVDLVATKEAYAANLKALKTSDEMLGTLLDVMAK
jgi:flagellar hook protein FlgE